MNAFIENMRMGNGNGRNLDANHPGNLRCPEPGCIDNEFSSDIAFIGFDKPLTRWFLLNTGHKGMKIQFGSIIPCPPGHGLGHGIRIHISIIRPVKTSHKSLGIHQGMQFSYFLRADKAYIQTQAPVHGIIISKLIHPVLIIRCPDGARGMPSCRLACLFFELLVYFNTLHIHLGAVKTRMIKGHIACCHPGGP